MKYISYDAGKAKAIFFTGDGGQDFKLGTAIGSENMEKAKKEFGLKDVGYCKQIHSDIINIYSGSLVEGDALVTDKAKLGVGVFDADCVPVLLYDSKKAVCAAVHSGWKGTYSHITLKTINFLKERYGSAPEDIKIFIGPHIGKCCYTVGEELIEKFMKDTMYQGHTIFDGYNLSLEECIKAQCLSVGVKEENIFSTNICTYCCEENYLHSYRRDGENSGRMFSMIFFED